MKLASLLLLFAMVSCAPKAAVVDEEPKPTPKPVATTDDSDKLQLPPQDNLGLLDPPGLTSMPSPKDMKPTVESANTGGSRLIATPGEKKTTSE